MKKQQCRDECVPYVLESELVRKREHNTARDKIQLEIETVRVEIAQKIENLRWGVNKEIEMLKLQVKSELDRNKGEIIQWLIGLAVAQTSLSIGILRFLGTA
ncbi:MAG: hypothetical protein N2Z22_11620 [Turneriella sp.]|nr:hypothetical protein [Turneriella sp.]